MFQKGGAAGGCPAGIGGKKRFSNGINLYPEVSSPSSASASISVSLPLLPDSPYGSATSAVHIADRESCSYDSGHTITKEHVPCFSNPSANFNTSPSFFELPPPPYALNAAMLDSSFSRFPRNVGVSAFPSLRTLQENLQLPFFYSSVTPPPMQGGGAAAAMSGYGSSTFGGMWPMVENQKPGATELDCIWSFLSNGELPASFSR